ncbi:MAG TPA: helix-turn-helix domain-containing protein [Dehalococcoidia bacterium]|nr:helix-turn-helix domain-containing protein [Dehalococcoidia bacterium]
MKRTSFAAWPCSIARTVELLGDWWSPLVLREAFFGIRRFDDFQETLGIGRNILTRRLRRLVEAGILERRKYQDRPARFEYLLTDKGRDFFPVLAAMVRWGDRWLDGGRGAPVLLRHRDCGQLTTPELVCGECGEPIAARDIRAEPGPGFPAERLPLRFQRRTRVT